MKQAPPPPSSAADAARFVKRSDSAIQRAYDAAAGPPSKQDAQAHGPPSAPPAPPTNLPPRVPSPTVGAGGHSPHLQNPSGGSVPCMAWLPRVSCLWCLTCHS